MKFNEFYNKRKQIVGMIHLPPLLSYIGFSGIKHCVEAALVDLKALEEAGFDGALLENDNDKPHTEFANPAQISAFTVIAKEVMDKAKISIGVQVMLNDWRASFAIAKVVGAEFTRLDVFVDKVSSEWGEINPDPEEIIAYKNKIYPELVLLSDIQVKHKKMIEHKDLLVSAKQAVECGANGLVITGEATGQEASMEDLVKVRDAFPNIPIWVGSGVNHRNIQEQLSVADGAIVGETFDNESKSFIEKVWSGN